MQVTDTDVFVPLELFPQGIWLNGEVSEHPSYAHDAANIYQHELFFEDGRCVAIIVKVPRRLNNELRS